MAWIRELPVLGQGLKPALGRELEPELELDPATLREGSKPLLPSEARKILQERKPDWLKIRPPGGEKYTQIKRMLRERGLHTVCEEAHCPNVSECWASGTATFMLGGDTCTRACRFCAVKTARRPPPLDPKEPKFVAESVSTLGLKYVVLTSVDRDDLEDQGALHFSETIREIKRLNPSILVEALVPDFRGDEESVRMIVESGLDVYAHNVETVNRLQGRVRDPRAGYLQSLETLRLARELGAKRSTPLYTKSAVMLGLGETLPELDQAWLDLRKYGVSILTIGQYLRPSLSHLPVEKFYTHEEFEAIGKRAREFGFLYVASGPFVRSSYRASELFVEGLLRGESLDFLHRQRKDDHP
jgi:lipoic acid synthetase